MTSTAPRIWDILNNCELKLEYPDLPETIRQSVEETMLKNISRCLDPIKAKGNCLRISDELMLNLSEVGKKPFIDCKIIHAKKPQPHFWIFVDGWHIDLTARQFDPKEPCPKIWKHEEIDSSSLYTVEKGKGPVLFKLVPFDTGITPVSSIGRLTRVLVLKLTKPVDLLMKIINEGFSTSRDRESSFR
jgi:hypothetical protein